MLAAANVIGRLDDRWRLSRALVKDRLFHLRVASARKMRQVVAKSPRRKQLSWVRILHTSRFLGLMSSTIVTKSMSLGFALAGVAVV
jgi:hypothetical protein